MEVIQEIRQIEEEAQQIIRQSVADARQIVSEAQTQSFKILDQAEREAETEVRKMIQEEERGVNEIILGINTDTEKECQELKKQAVSKMDVAVDMIVGRIVKADVGS